MVQALSTRLLTPTSALKAVSKSRDGGDFNSSRQSNYKSRRHALLPAEFRPARRHTTDAEVRSSRSTHLYRTGPSSSKHPPVTASRSVSHWRLSGFGGNCGDLGTGEAGGNRAGMLQDGLRACRASWSGYGGGARRRHSWDLFVSRSGSGLSVWGPPCSYKVAMAELARVCYDTNRRGATTSSSFRSSPLLTSGATSCRR